MALDQRKRQKSIEKRNAKRKAHKKTVSLSPYDEILGLMRRGAHEPILHCCVTANMWNTGMGTLLFSRGEPGGTIVGTVYLLDTFCLGIKDVTCVNLTWNAYQSQVVDRLFKQFAMVNLAPEAALKLLEGAVEFTRSYELSPHTGFEQYGRLLFGKIDATTCTEEFVFGKDGRPFYIQGPHDSSTRVAQIMATLANHPGSGGIQNLNEDTLRTIEGQATSASNSADELAVGLDQDEFDGDDSDDDFGTGLDR